MQAIVHVACFRRYASTGQVRAVGPIESGKRVAFFLSPPKVRPMAQFGDKCDSMSSKSLWSPLSQPRISESPSQAESLILEDT